ncbi:carboxypeptidase-like regulatory domain-containing protein [Candidatus Nitrospira bockiana]
MEVLVVQLPRGCSAIGVDVSTNVAFTNHNGIFSALMENGVRDLDGVVRYPREGRTFLSAVYDFLFLNGYRVYMESWALSIDHPYYAMTGPDGRFTLSDVPPGQYRLVAWHPAIGVTMERPVTVPSGGSVTQDFLLQAPEGRRSAHELVENPHYGPEALGKPLQIVPTLILQRP